MIQLVISQVNSRDWKLAIPTDPAYTNTLGQKSMIDWDIMNGEMHSVVVSM